jgi:NAD(P)-dependent dehydrogenase (short-subunit alcohol dehydrogenase family)
VFLGLKHQIPAIHAAGGGAAYSAAKHGLVGLSKSAALEWADRRVRVNAIVTGNVDTPLYRRLLDASPDQPRDQLQAPNPTGRVSDPTEIAGLVAFLLSDEAAFINLAVSVRRRTELTWQRVNS